MTGGRLDSQVVRERLAHLVETVRSLREFQSLSFEELSSTPRYYWAVERGLEICIQAVLDVAAHLVAILGGPIGERYRDLLLALGEYGVLPTDFAQKLAPMAGFRNVLVHEYLEVDLREVHRVLTRELDDFLVFAAHVERFLTEREAAGRAE